jgi:predicted RNA-binding Zn-ribbon protein involved in translation (DUF1610 family)
LRAVVGSRGVHHRRLRDGLQNSPGLIDEIRRKCDVIVTVPSYHGADDRGSGLSLSWSADSTLAGAGPERRESRMQKLVHSSPSINATSAPCPQCGGPMNIKLVEPHPTASKKENHTFQCSECGFPRTYVMKLN